MASDELFRLGETARPTIGGRLMPRDTRTYITVHDGMPDHPKIDPLSDAAFRLLVSLWCLCSRNESDGRVPMATWKKRGSARVRAELMSAGLVEQISDTEIAMHDYLQHQRSADEIAALRKKRADAGRKGGQSKANAVASARRLPEQTAGKAEAETEDAFQASQKDHSSNASGSSNAPVGAVARIVKLYVESAKSAGVPAPEESQDRVSRSAKSLLAQGFPAEVIEDAARNAAVGGWADLSTQVQRDAARAKPTNGNGGSTADQRFMAGVQLAELLDRKAIGS